MKATETTIDRILSGLLEYGNYAIYMKKFENKLFKGQVTTRHILYKDFEELIVEYSKRKFIIEINNEWQRIKQNETS